MKTRSPPEEKRGTKKLFLPLFIAGIMIMSAFGVIFGGFSDTSSPAVDGTTIAGATFSQQPTGRWDVRGEGFALNLQYGPSDLETLEKINAAPLRTAQKIYLSYQGGKDYLNTLPDFYQNMRSAITLSLACQEDGPGCEDLPLKTCADAKDDAVVVMVTIAEQPRAIQQGSCYQLEGDAQTLNKLIDHLILSYWGVDL